MKKINKILTALSLSKSLDSQQGSTYVLLTRRLVRATALTVSCMMAAPSFAQPLNCDGGYWDEGAQAWICPQTLPGGDPWGWPTNPNGSGPDISGEGCSPADPNCFSDEGGDGGDGGDSNPPDNNNLEQCLAVSRNKASDNCTDDPGSEANINWDNDGISFRDSLPISQWLPGNTNGHPSNSWYQDLIDVVSGTYWDHPNSYAVSSTYWFEAVSYCAPYPYQNGSPGSISNPTYSYCMNIAYELSFAFAPELYNYAWTVNGLSQYGISMRVHQADDPLANWAHNHYQKVNRLKRCVGYYDQEEQLGCNN